MTTSRKALVLCAMLLFASHASSASDSDFSEVFEEGNFPASSHGLIWSDQNNVTHFGQMYYPATTQGTATPIDNTSGPNSNIALRTSALREVVMCLVCKLSHLN